jgi:hypothetical protein
VAQSLYDLELDARQMRFIAPWNSGPW